jgi:hypothetical protein
MANIVVRVAKDTTGNKCLKIMDGDECQTNPIESGIALRRIIHQNESVTWSNPDGKTLTITFANGNPFGAPLAPGTSVNANVLGNATQGRYKYTIVVSDSTGTLASEDPQVVVDSGSIQQIRILKAKAKKKAKKK